MTPTSLLLIFGVLACSSLLGIHIAFGFALAASIGLYFTFHSVGPVVDLLQQTALTGMKDYNFAVIPLFTVMGLLIAKAGAAGDLFNIVNRRLANVPGRLAVATVLGNAIFAAVTGVGAAAAAAFSHIAYPDMRANGYSRPFATGCIAGSAVLGLLIPPSVFMIVWAILTEQSVARLFAAGLIPGLILASLYAAYAYATFRWNPNFAREIAVAEGVAPAPTRSERIGSIGVALLILTVLGGMWGGYFTPTEGAAFGLLGALLLAVAKGASFQTIVAAFVDAGKTITPILLLIICATIYTKLLALEGVSDLVQEIMVGWGLGPVGAMLFMVVVWFLLGCLIDSISIMLLTVPLFWPIASNFGYEPISFALVGILVIEAGVLTPPFGMNCFVVKASVPDHGLKLSQVFVGAVPYWIMILIVAMLVQFVPSVATFLPNLM